MKMLIEKGVSVTYVDVLQQTVLFYVAREGKLECIDLLIKSGNFKIHRNRL